MEPFSSQEFAFPAPNVSVDYDSITLSQRTDHSLVESFRIRSRTKFHHLWNQRNDSPQRFLRRKGDLSEYANQPKPYRYKYSAHKSLKDSRVTGSKLFTTLVTKKKPFQPSKPVSLSPIKRFPKHTFKLPYEDAELVKNLDSFDESVKSLKTRSRFIYN